MITFKKIALLSLSAVLTLSLAAWGKTENGIIKDNDTPYRLKLNKVSQWEGTDVVWLRYTVKH